jgi:tetratricopeptide (TPR) repeat protein
VENTVCTKINAGVAASSGAALAGKTLLGYAAGAVGIAVIAVVSYWATTSYRQSVPQPEAPRAVAERRQPAVETNPHILEDNSSTEIIGKNSKRPAETKISQNTVTEKQNLPESQSLPVQNALSATNNDAEIKAPANAERLLKDIKSYSELYVQAVAAGNQINAADNAKNLGLLYGKLNDAKQARLYFGRSAAAAQAAGIVESEAEAYGQWGIMEAKAGDIATAQECLGKAVRLLNEINVSSSKWQAQLDKLNAVK